MSDGLFKVVLTGALASDREPAEVHTALAGLFSMSETQVIDLLASAPITVRADLDHETARKYQLAIEQAGALCELRQTGEAVIEGPAGGAAPTATTNVARDSAEPRMADAPQHAGKVSFRRLNAGNGAGWWGDAWILFKSAPLVWVAIGVLYVLLLVVPTIVPVVGLVAPTLLGPVLLGGIMLAAHGQRSSGEPPPVSRLFDGFGRAPGPLLAVGGVYLAGSLLAFAVVGGMVMMLGMGAALGGGMGMHGGFGAMAASGSLLGGLVAVAVTLPLYAALWFAPPLIVLDDVPVGEALKLSFLGCVYNWLPMLVYGLLMLVFGLLAVVTFGLGMFVLAPLAMISVYTAYRDIYAA